MLNRNFVLAVMSTLNGGVNKIPLKKTDGDYFGVGVNSSGANILNAIKSVSNNKIPLPNSICSTFSFGSSNQPEDYDDYNVISPIDMTNFSVTNSSSAAVNNWNDIVLSQLWTYTGTDTLEIKEIGLFASVNESVSGQYYGRTVMFARTVLKESDKIICTPNTSFTVTFKIGGSIVVTQ